MIYKVLRFASLGCLLLVALGSFVSMYGKPTEMMQGAFLLSVGFIGVIASIQERKV